MSFGERFKNARDRKRMSQQQLANFLDVTDGTISNYEKGVAFPRWESIKRICELLEVDPNYLFWDDLSDKIKNLVLEQNNLKKYNEFSPDGMKKIDDYINDLLENPRYRKETNNRNTKNTTSDEYELVAFGGEGNIGYYEDKEEEIT